MFSLFSFCYIYSFIWIVHIQLFSSLCFYIFWGINIFLFFKKFCFFFIQSSFLRFIIIFLIVIVTQFSSNMTIEEVSDKIIEIINLHIFFDFNKFLICTPLHIIFVKKTFFPLIFDNFVSFLRNNMVISIFSKLFYIIF